MVIGRLSDGRIVRITNGKRSPAEMLSGTSWIPCPNDITVGDFNASAPLTKSEIEDFVSAGILSQKEADSLPY